MYDERTEARLRELSSENTLLKDRLSRMKGELGKVSEFVGTPMTERTSFVGFQGEHFVGPGPYTGWDGMGLALNEALDERDYLRQLCEQQQETINRLQHRGTESEEVLTREDTDAGC